MNKNQYKQLTIKIDSLRLQILKLWDMDFKKAMLSMIKEIKIIIIGKMRIRKEKNKGLRTEKKYHKQI